MTTEMLIDQKMLEEAEQRGYGMVTKKDYLYVRPKFYWRAQKVKYHPTEHDPQSLKTETHPNGKNKEINDYIQVAYVTFGQSSGDVYDAPVEKNPKWKELFPNEWNAFLKNEESPPDGMPIDRWAAIGIDEAAKLREHGIFTVEQLSAVPDSALQNLPPMVAPRKIRDLAREYVNRGDLNEQLQSQEQRIAELEALLKASVEETPKPRRGRPPRASKEENVSINGDSTGSEGT